MRLSEAIQNCAAIERVIAEVYEIFATRWPGPPLGILWRELAAEGVAHGRLLEKAARLPAADRDDPSINRTKLEAMRNFVNERFPSGPLSVHKALALALDLEDLDLENIHRRLFALAADDYRASAMRTPISQGNRRVSRIAKAVQEHSYDPRLLARARDVQQRVLRTGRFAPMWRRPSSRFTRSDDSEVVLPCATCAHWSRDGVVDSIGSPGSAPRDRGPSSPPRRNTDVRRSEASPGYRRGLALAEVQQLPPTGGRLSTLRRRKRADPAL